MIKVIGIITLCCFLSGCATLYPVGLVFTEVQLPNHCVTEGDVSYSKTGTAVVKSILKIVAIGDASIDAAIRNGGITKVKYVDYEARSILGIYGEYKTTVYGD